MWSGGVRSVLVGVLALCFLQSCDRAGETTDVTIWLDWAEAPSEATSFVTDLGYFVQLTRLEVTTYSVELIPCDLQIFQDLQNGVYATQASLSLVSPAHAAHADPERPTRTNGVEVEVPLNRNSALRFADLTPPAVDYCRLHYLIGRVPNDAPSPSAGVSLWVEGRYAAPDGSNGTINLKSAMAFGRNVDLTGSTGEPISGPLLSPTNISVDRNWQQAFSGAQLNKMDDDTLTRHILRALVNSVTATAVTGDAS